MAIRITDPDPYRDIGKKCLGEVCTVPVLLIFKAAAKIHAIKSSAVHIFEHARKQLCLFESNEVYSRTTYRATEDPWYSRAERIRTRREIGDNINQRSKRNHISADKRCTCHPRVIYGRVMGRGVEASYDG